MVSKHGLTNDQVADQLEHVADLLETLGKNQFKVMSYRRAAGAVRHASKPLSQVWEKKGADGLRQIKGVGQRIAGSIGEILDTGRLGLIDRLESEVSPEAVLARVPGVGEKTARQIHSKLGIESLEELEIAAHDGRLERLEGIGPKTLDGVRNALAGMLSRSAQRRSRKRRAASSQVVQGDGDGPSVKLLLEIDAEYRKKAAEGELRTIAPRRFNPEGESWLPVLNARRNKWSFTALFSNTSRAHELGKTRDWVVLYYKRDGTEDQCTVITKSSGPLRGKRVVRGREQECKAHYGA